MPLTLRPPVGTKPCTASPNSRRVDPLTWMAPGLPVLSMREAVLTVSPKRQKRGILRPTVYTHRHGVYSTRTFRWMDGTDS